MRRASCLGLIVALLACVSCRSDEEIAIALMKSPEVAARASRFEQARAEQAAQASGDSSAAGMAIARWVLPASLREISGVALSADGRLFANGDESGVVTVLDYRTGVMIKEFVVGKRSTAVDFEGITVANESIFMIVSTGDLYEFREGPPGAAVPFAIHKMELEKVCEFEGVAYAPAIESLLLACKNIYDKSLRDSLVIFRWALSDTLNSSVRLTRMTLPLANLTTPIQSKTMRPSDIAVDPVSGNYFLVAAQEKALMAITPAGVVVFVRQLPAEHEQAEGLAITKDGVIIIGDEALRTGAMLTMYRKP